MFIGGGEKSEAPEWVEAGKQTWRQASRWEESHEGREKGEREGERGDTKNRGGGREGALELE